MRVTFPQLATAEREEEDLVQIAWEAVTMILLRRGFPPDTLAEFILDYKRLSEERAP